MVGITSVTHYKEFVLVNQHICIMCTQKIQFDILKYAEIFLIVMDSENNWIIVHWLLPPIEIEVRGFMNHNRRSVNNNTSNGQIFFLLFCRPPQNVNRLWSFNFMILFFLLF